MRRIFLIAGHAQNGKDSTADIMMEQLKGKSIKLSYAEYLKMICSKFFNWDGNKDEKGRSTLQYVGTELIRDKLGWQDFHVDRVCQDIKIAEEEFDYFFVSDTRRKNEIFIVEKMFPDLVTTIRVERNNFKSPLTNEQQNHISEIDLDDFSFDYYLCAENGLDNLRKEVTEFVYYLEEIGEI